MDDIVVIDGEVELENTLDGEVELMSQHSLDPQVYLGTGGGSIVVDTAMSDTSENAVQNKVIKAYVDAHGGGGGSADPATSQRYGTVKAQYSHEPSTAQLKLTFHAPTSPQETEISAISPTVQVDGSGNVTQAIYAKYLPDGTGTKKGAFLRAIWNGSITDGYDEMDGEGYDSSVGGYARTVTTAEGGFVLADGNRVVFETGYWDGSYNHYINVDSTGYKEVMLTDSIHMGIGTTGSVFGGSLEVVYEATDQKFYVVNGYALAHATGSRYGTVKVSPDTSSGNNHAVLTYGSNSNVYIPLVPSGSGTITSKYLPKADYQTYGAIKINPTNEPAYGYIEFTYGSSNSTAYAPILPSTSGTIRAKWLPDATSSTKGAVILKSSITPGDTNAVNSVAVIDYIASSSGMTDAVKEALLDCFEHVAWIDDDGQVYYQGLYNAMYGVVTITNNLTGCTTSNSASSMSEGDPYTATITASTGYVLTGATVSITMGGVDITSTAYNNGTISIAEVTGSLVITITAVAVTLVSISAVYTQSGTVTTSTPLDNLKTDLVVTATYSDSSTATVPSADYTLSGTLTEGTSTITVTYNGKTTTFTVTVSQPVVLVTHTYANNQYTAISNPSDMVLTSGMVASGGPSTQNGRVDPSATAVSGRAADTQRVLVGNFGSKTLGLSSYTLSSGASVGFSCWFGKLTDLTWNGNKYVNGGDNYVAKAWLTSDITLPASNDTNVLVMAFRKGNGSVGDFTAEELAEIPTLIQIS